MEKNIIEGYMHRMGLDGTQYIATEHRNTEHPHFHILVNRVFPDGHVYKTGFERSRSVNKLIQRRIILLDEPRNAYHLSMDRLALNNRVACKCSAGDHSNEHTPLLLSDDCTHSQLPMLIHSSKYIVRKLTIDGKEFDVMGTNEDFEGSY